MWELVRLLEEIGYSKGRLNMLRKIVLLMIMGVALAGAGATATPAPVLWMMGGLIIFALSIAMHSEQQG